MPLHTMAMPLAMGGSVEVGNDFAKVMEDSLLTNLLNDGDSTGVAHLAGNTTIQSQTVNRVHKQGRNRGASRIFE